MPYKSQAQAAFMHIHHPEIAKRWDSEIHKERRMGNLKAHTLPKHVKKSNEGVEE